MVASLNVKAKTMNQASLFLKFSKFFLRYNSDSNLCFSIYKPSVCYILRRNKRVLRRYITFPELFLLVRSATAALQVPGEKS